MRRPVGQIRLDRSDLADLLLKSDDALPRVGHPVIVRDDPRVLRRQRIFARDEVLPRFAARRVLQKAGQLVVWKRVDQDARAVE